jgi:hypothetical protein
MPQSLHYSIITILLLGNRTHRRIYIYMSLPLFRRALLPPTGTIPLTGLVRQDIYNVWLSVINLSTITGLPPRIRWCDRLVASPSSGPAPVLASDLGLFESGEAQGTYERGNRDLLGRSPAPRVTQKITFNLTFVHVKTPMLLVWSAPELYFIARAGSSLYHHDGFCSRRHQFVMNGTTENAPME